ncbi:uncharacterized protein LOC116264789 [Nymphaea colorata]|nr:uncharacterized protein LOC116264789 [Nymphaea colorata]
MATAACTVQRVNKASSEQLLRKFADMESEPARRSKKMKPVPSSSRMTSALIERNSLLPPSSNQRTRMFWTFKCNKSGRRARQLLRNQFFLALVKQRWDQTVETASKMLLEKHCNPHVRLKDESV